MKNFAKKYFAVLLMSLFTLSATFASNDNKKMDKETSSSELVVKIENWMVANELFSNGLDQVIKIENWMVTPVLEVENEIDTPELENNLQIERWMLQSDFKADLGNEDIKVEDWMQKTW